MTSSHQGACGLGMLCIEAAVVQAVVQSVIQSGCAWVSQVVGQSGCESGCELLVRPSSGNHRKSKIRSSSHFAIKDLRDRSEKMIDSLTSRCIGCSCLQH